MPAITLICRDCGDVHDLPEGQEHRACPACGTINCRPQAEGEALERLQRATRLRLAGDYAMAEKCYNHVLMDYEEEHEALWGRCLCHYGVEAVNDGKTGGRHLLVHFPRRKPLQEQADFLQACELAPEWTARQYAQDAAYIDDAQAEIRRLAKHCPPYDVFICHKTTCLDSQAKTEDYNRAFLLYHRLDKLGYRVFFAPAEMEGVAAGADYEAAIYHALHTAKVMLLICSDPAYLASTWVQSEWKRYLELVDESDERCLLPLLYGGMPANKLPREFRLRRIEAVTMENFDAQENVLRVLRQFCAKQEPVNAAPVQQVLYVPAVPQKPEYATRPAEGGCEITRYHGAGGDVSVPEQIGGQPVVALGSGAFDGCTRLTAAILPEGLRRIAEKAFFGCTALRSVQLPQSLTEIGNMAFSGCMALQSAEIPDQVQSLGHYAFYDCRALRSVRLPQGLTGLGVGVFHGCGSLTEIELPPTLTQIDRAAFGACKGLTALSIPRSVTSIHRDAFTGCSALTLHVLRDSAAHAHALSRKLPFELIRNFAPETDFQTGSTREGCVITGYTGPGGQVEIPQWIRGEQVVEIGQEAFARCSALREVVIPEGVTLVGMYAFNECAGLTGVSLPKSLRSIHSGAFSDCVSLRSMALPEGLHYLSDDVFSGCTGLEEVCLPASLTEIRWNPFPDCPALVNIRIDPLNPRYCMRDRALLSREMKLQCLPAGLAETSYEVPAYVTGIEHYAFEGCRSLKRVRVPASVTEFDPYAFGAAPLFTLEVDQDSAAHQYAQKNGLLFTLAQDVVTRVRTAPAAPVRPDKPAAPEKEPQTTELKINRSRQLAYAVRQIGVRVDGKNVYYLGNGESITLSSLVPGFHVVDIAVKPLFGGEVNWDSPRCRKDIFKEYMLPGRQYAIDLADWLIKLVF